MGTEPPARVRVSGAGVARPGNGGVGEQAELLAIAIQSAQMAGALLMERFEEGVAKGVRSKSTPTDLVSEADFASQRAIRELLAELRPGDRFLGEEDEDEHSPHGDTDADSSLRWVVDPLDGTVNFLFGIPQWCVSVAVQDADGVTLTGAIFDPCRDETWAAGSDGEATLNGAPVSPSRCAELAYAMVATGLYYDAAVRAEQGRVLANLAPKVRDIRRFGSAALDMAWTAAGRFDAYFERGAKLWDVAAGALICRCAGLEVVDLDPHELVGVVLPTGILVAPPSLTDSLRALVA